MPVYFVSYDLIEAFSGEKRDYQAVYAQISEFEHFEVLYSEFLVEADSASSVEETLTQALRKTDRYFITRLHSNWYKYRAMKGVNQWLEDHPPG